MKSLHAASQSLTLLATLSLGFISLTTGCQSSFFRAQSPDSTEPLVDEETDVDLVSKWALPTGLHGQKVEFIGLVNGLAGTGSDPPPTPERQALIDDIQTYDVDHPNEILSWNSTAMVQVTGIIPPGAQKGDRFDILVRTPRRSETESLRGGWLMPTRLREHAVINGSTRSSLQLAMATGSVLVDSMFDGSDDEMLERRGRVLGGGVVGKSRPLGLAVRSQKGSITVSTLIGKAINRRFHRFEHGIKKGVATPKRDNYIELAVHARYRNNLTRYLRVVRAIPLRQNAIEMPARLERLEQQLLEPTTAAKAAIMLEAIGPEAIPKLQRGAASNDPEVKFYSAEALAYLDVEEAAKPLANATDEPAFRWHALTALAAMDQVAAYDELTELLQANSAETRYGAFYALRTRNPSDPLVTGEAMGDDYYYHVVPSVGEPLVHFTRYKRPEIVVFGHHIEVRPPKYLFAGPNILIKGTEEGKLKVSRFQAGDDEDRHEVCPADLNSMIRAIERLGGGYAEVMQAIHEAKKQGDLQARVVVDAIPHTRRRYERDADRDEASDEAETPHFQVANPIPEMFSNELDEEDRKKEGKKRPQFENDDPSEGGILSTMGEWFGY